jgi:DNA repair protein NreA
MLCGKLNCPILSKAQALTKYSPLLNSQDIRGSTPPGVFVGHIGYPMLYIGPMVPPFYGETEILDTPEKWMGKSVDEIIDYRYSLIRGKARAHVLDTQRSSRLLENLQELSMSVKPTDSEMLLAKLPRKILSLDDNSQPFGPSALMQSFKMSNPSVDRRIEKAFYDDDLKASEAVLNLYQNDVYVTKIQRSFSVGMFGLEKRRRIVPTRWSITAVDSIISKELIDEIKEYGTIDEYRIYSFNYLDNIYVVLLSPEKWKFEWIEAWFPGTTWNLDGTRTSMIGDGEGYWGRKTYPGVGGCYYSTRLAAAEKLKTENRQASVLALREIHKGYTLPVGVWNVRESIRATLRTEPELYDNFQSAINGAMIKMTIPLRVWMENSWMLREMYFQKKITDYAGGGGGM